MSKFDIKMPKLGESITEGTIVSMNVKLGDMVEEDQVLFEVTTAKVSAEVPSAVAGKVVEMKFKEGDTVDVGLTVLVIDLAGEDAQVTATVETTADATPETEATTTKTETTKSTKNDDRWYSPVVLQMAKQANIGMEDLANIEGSGFQGRLTKKDIKNHIENRPAASKAQPSEKTITAPAAPSQTPKATTPATPVTFSGDDIVKDMDAVGKIIADRMVQSKHTSPHVTTIVEVDVTKLVNWRKKKKDEFRKQEGLNLTYMPAIIEATTQALKKFPKINASVDGYKYILKKNINIGVAVALEDENLVVPVIKNADKLNISGLANAVEDLSSRARSNKLAMSDIEGGTFTITNFGTFKNIIGTPIINQPEVAILGVGYIEKKPAVIETPEGDVIAIRHKMYLSLSYDHRIINGAVGGEFLLNIANYLENWSE